jgi:hypothetical protein
MRRRLSYANVVATLALVFAMSGGALAANHYLINSTKQINPKVLKALANQNKKLFQKLAKTVTVAKATSAVTAGTAATAGSATSALSATNATNATNAANATNASSASSSATLGKGQTETGVWSANDTNNPAYGAISFVHPLTSPPTPHLIPPGGPVPPGCSGTTNAPGASPGQLCVFAQFLFNSEFAGIFDPGTAGSEEAAGKHGAVVFLFKTGAGHFDGAGTWAVTG